MPNTLSLETALEVATARGDAWKGIASDLCEIMQGVVDSLLPIAPELAESIADVARGPIEKGYMIETSEELEEGAIDAGQTYDGSVRLGSDELVDRGNYEDRIKEVR